MFDTVLNMRQYVFLFKALIPEKKIFQETVHNGGLNKGGKR